MRMRRFWKKYHGNDEIVQVSSVVWVLSGWFLTPRQVGTFVCLKRLLNVTGARKCIIFEKIQFNQSTLIVIYTFLLQGAWHKQHFLFKRVNMIVHLYSWMYICYLKRNNFPSIIDVTMEFKARWGQGMQISQKFSQNETDNNSGFTLYSVMWK